MTTVQKLLARCDAGWTIAQKWGLTALALVYVVSPIDPIPDVLIGPGQLDDLFIAYCLYRVWQSPTLPSVAASTSIEPASI